MNQDDTQAATAKPLSADEIQVKLALRESDPALFAYDLSLLNAYQLGTLVHQLWATLDAAVARADAAERELAGAWRVAEEWETSWQHVGKSFHDATQARWAAEEALAAERARGERLALRVDSLADFLRDSPECMAFGDRLFAVVRDYREGSTPATPAARAEGAELT